MVNCSRAELDEVFRALADPLRRQLVSELRFGQRTVGQLHANTTVSLVAVMKHVEVLEGARVVQTEKLGRARVCRLRPERLQLAESWLSETRSFWANALTQLYNHIDEETP